MKRNVRISTATLGLNLLILALWINPIWAGTVWADTVSAPYPVRLPVEQYLMADQASEIALAVAIFVVGLSQGGRRTLTV